MLEGLEKLGDLFLRKPDSGVGKGEAYVRRFPGGLHQGGGYDNVTGHGEFDGVAQQIRQNLAQAERVPFKVVWNVPINRWELYYLSKDPKEHRNLAKSDKATLEPLKKKLKLWRSVVLKRRESRPE